MIDFGRVSGLVMVDRRFNAGKKVHKKVWCRVATLEIVDFKRG
jgi:hypothetical protein